MKSAPHLKIFLNSLTFTSRSNRQRHATLLELCHVMKLSPALKKIAGTCWLAAVFAHFGWAQTFVTNGIESGITGPMAGEQLHPHSSLNSGGGFMVWDDNVSDGRG